MYIAHNASATPEARGFTLGNEVESHRGYWGTEADSEVGAL